MYKAVKFWCLCLVCIVFCLASPGLAEADDGLPLEWKYFAYYVEPGAGRDWMQLPYEDDRWQKVSMGDRLNLIGQRANCVQYTTIMSSNLYDRSPLLFFVTYNEAVRVFCDNQLIYGRGEFATGDKVQGTRWHLVVLPDDFRGRQLTIQLFSENRNVLGSISHVSLDEPVTQMKQLFYHDAGSIVLISLTLLVILLLFLVDSGQRKLESICLIAYLAIWMLEAASGLWVGFLLLDKPVFWHYVFYIALFLQPFPMGFLVYRVLDGVGRYLAWLFLAGNAVFLLEALLGTYLGYDAFTHLAHEQGVWSVYGTLVAAVLLFLQERHGEADCRNLSLMIFAVFCLEVLDRQVIGASIVAFPGISLNISSLPIIVYVLWMIRHTIAEKWQLNREKAELEHKVKQERYKAQIDPLTKCFTRRKLEHALQFAVNSAEYLGIPVSLLMVDIDKFKSINDTYGHAVGDQVLKGVADIMRRHTGFSHTLARYGGEEFMIVCLMHGMDRAKVLAERIRSDVEKAVLIEGRQVTCSIGISCWHIKSGDTPDALQKRADDALYFAKNNGRNRCVAENEIK